ncbi:hypothetical protein K439DRAFT_1650556 [Ramaria rubella]|nr:hypothetical protein K439DRAFT_1650556 [Ramaria rubella]
MASTAIPQLLQPPNRSISEQRALCFINSTLKTISQHDHVLETAVEDTRRKTVELRARLQASQNAVDECVRNTLSLTRRHIATAQELSLTRHALTDELTSLSSELVSSLNNETQSKPTLLEELESLHRSLKELESVRGYISIIEHALRLSEAAVDEVRGTLSSSEGQTFSFSCLKQYRLLQSFVITVSSRCVEVENPPQIQPFSSTTYGEQPLKFVSFLFKVRDRTWSDIKHVLTSALLAAAERMGWPQPIEYSSVPPQDRALFELKFLDLIRLQDVGDEVHASDPQWKKDGIYAIQALASPIALRFKFHFDGKKDTNRIDKPEWYFTHIINVTHTHRHFLETSIQSLLLKTQHKHINAFREFTLHLLPSISRKLRHTIPQLLQYPSILAHTIYQALAFDASLREQGFALEGTTAIFTKTRDLDRKDELWGGVSEQILGNKEWFEAWLEGERKFTENQYNNIISSPNAWQFTDDMDGTDVTDTETNSRTTISARRVKALIEQITDRYQPLPRFAARTRFLISIQIPILESYHSRISSSLDAFETLSSSFVRAVPGALAGQIGHGTDTRSLTSGVEGVGRLVKAGISAHYMAGEMERWGDDIFFLELWSEINARAALRVRAEAHPLLPDPSEKANSSTLQDVEAIAKGTIFQELVTQYRNLGERAEDMVVRHVCSEIESAARIYFSSQWDESDTLPDEKGVSMPSTLVAPISLLSQHLVFLMRSLPSSLATTLYRRIASTLAAIILQQRVQQRSTGRLSLAKAKQIGEECLLWIQACRSIGHPMRRIEGPWARLLDAIKILILDEEEFRITVDHIFSAGADDLEKLQEELGVTELDLGDLIDIVRLREDCWR